MNHNNIKKGFVMRISIVSYPKHIIDNICTDYISGISTIILSEKYNIPKTSIIRILKKHNIPMKSNSFYRTNNPSKPRMFTADEEHKICEEYTDKIHVPDIAKERGCDITTIYNILKRGGINCIGKIHFYPKPIELFKKKYVVQQNGCWEWILPDKSVKHYPRFVFYINGNRYEMQAHRYSYTYYIGDIKRGNIIHHRCENIHCVNPNHLQQLEKGKHTLIHNSITGRNKRKTHCKNGHKFTHKNTYIRPKTGHRVCKTCAKIRDNIKHNRPTQ